jgi:hypothetical protein
MPTNSNATNYFSPARWVVSKVAGEGTHTTISAALAVASAGDTIVVMAGTYTENPSLVASVNIVAWNGDALTPTVIINGNCTATFAGECSISGICLQTNSASLLTVSGSSATNVNLKDCNINCLNSTGISFSSSSATSGISLVGCYGNIATTGISLYTMSAAGGLSISYTNIENNGSSTTASTASSGVVTYAYSELVFPTVTSGTAVISVNQCQLTTNGSYNAVALTHGGSASFCTLYNSYLQGGTSSALVVNSTLTCSNCIINSTATSAVGGSGTIISNGFFYVGTSYLMNTTTQTNVGTIQGIRAGNAPAAGFLGEQIRSAVASGSSISLSTTVAANITSISLTPGIWDVSSIINSTAQTTTCTAYISSISTTSATTGTNGDNRADGQPPSSTLATSVSIPAYRLTLAATTTVYLVAQANFSAGTVTVFGRISATRVG